MSSNAHSAADLAQMQCLPLEAKERMSMQRIKVWFNSWTRFEICNNDTGKTRFATIDTRDIFAEPAMKEAEYIVSAETGAVYVSFSGGKDSTVLADLCARVCQSCGYTLYLLFVNTGLEYPEIQKFVKTFAEWLRQTYKIEVVLDIVRPEMRFDEVIKNYGYPVISKSVSHAVKIAKRNPNGKVMKNMFDPKNKSRFNCSKWEFLIYSPIPASEECCNVMKKTPAKKYAKATGRKAIIGTLATESSLRYAKWLQNGCNAFDSKNPSSQPLSFWTNQDILRYLKFRIQPKLDKHWENATTGTAYVRRKSRKFLKKVGYMRSALCSVYGDIVIDLKDDAPAEQINIIDYLGEYEPEDKLKTTGCDRTGCIFCMFGCHLEKEPNRFQRLKITHPRQYEYCIGGGEFVWEGTAYTSCGEPREIPWINDDDSPMSNEEIEKFVNEHKGKEHYKFVRKWQPTKAGLGLGKVLDYIGVKYD